MTKWEKLEDYFSKKSMMEILGVDRDENAHSKFLGWLFENEDTREVAIKSLLVLLKNKRPELKDVDEFQSMNIDNVKVILEDFVEAGEDRNKYYGRADIVLEVTYDNKQHLYVIIENKIDSFEHKMGKGQKEEDAEGAMWQTVGYYYYYKEKYGEENCVFVFLTRPNIDEKKCIKFFKDKSRKNNGRPQCDSFIWINYQNVLDSILVKVLDSIKESLKGTKQTKDSCTSLSEITIRINDYIRCLGINKTQENLMAISSDSEIAKLADEIWEECLRDKGKNLLTHQELIRPLFEVLYHIKNDVKIQKIRNIINGKDYTTYVIKKGEENKGSGLTKNGLVKKVVELYLENNKQEELKGLKEHFSPKLRMVNKSSRAKEESLSNQVVINLEEYVQKKKELKGQELLIKESPQEAIDKDKHWEKLMRDEKPTVWYVIQTGWDGQIIMNHFIKHAERLLSGYNIQECVSKNKLDKIFELIKQ